MHAPSEHTIAGKPLDFELHIVHLNADGTRAGVLGFMFDRELGGSGENQFLSQILLPDPDYNNKSYGRTGSGAVIHETNSAKASLKGFLDSVDLTRFWSYSGSLTTPTCDEIVEWTVFSDVQPISQAQLESFQNLWKVDGVIYGTARETLPLHGRDLRYVQPVPEKSKQEEVAESAAITFGVLFIIVLLTLIATLAVLFAKPECFGLEKSKGKAKDQEAAKDRN